jgi:hypothetical protein
MTVGDQPFTESAAPDANDIDPVDIRIVDDITETRREAPDYGSSNTFTLQLAGAAQPVQILQRRIKRSKARIIVTSMSGGSTSPTLPNSASAQGQVTSPGAGANISGTIAAANLPAGLYQVTAVTYIDGTPAAATDDDNMKFNQSGGGIQTHIAVPSTGVPTTTTMLVNFSGAQTIQIQSSNVATAGAVYHASLTVTPISLTVASAAAFHNQTGPLSNPVIPPGVGVQIFTAPFTFDWESQQPLYGVGVGGLVTVSVIDESYE